MSLDGQSLMTELLVQAQLNREYTDLPPASQGDFRRVLELAPRLLEELLKIAVIQRPPRGYGWLRSTVGVVELIQLEVASKGKQHTEQ